MRTLTPNRMQQYLVDYDYDSTLEQSKEILEILSDLGTFSSDDIEIVANHILNGEQKKFSENFY